MMAPPIPTTTPMTVLRVCVVMPDELEVEDCGEAVPVARPVLVEVEEERRVLVTPLITVVCVCTMMDLDVKSEVTRDAEWVDELWLVEDDDVGEKVEESEVGDEIGVEELREVVLDDAAADGGELEGALVDEAAADGVGVVVVTAPVLAGEDDPAVPPNNPVAAVTCEMTEEISSVRSFFWCCPANTFESSQLAWATATTAKATRVCRYNILTVLMEKLMKERLESRWCAGVAPTSYSMK